MQWIPATRTQRLIITFNLHDADVADVNTKPICVRSGINNAHKSSVGSHRSFPFGNCFGHASYHWAVWFQQRATDTWLLTVWMRPASSATQTQRANPLAVKITRFSECWLERNIASILGTRCLLPCQGAPEREMCNEGKKRSWPQQECR